MLFSLIRSLFVAREPKKTWAPAIEIPDGQCAAALGIYARA